MTHKIIHRYLTKRNKNICFKKTYRRMLIAALHKIVLKWRQPKFPLRREWKKCIHYVIIKWGTTHHCYT